MLAMKNRSRLFEIGDIGDIDPAFRHRDHHFGTAKAQASEEMAAVIGVGHVFADQVLAGHPQMDTAEL